MILPSSSGGRTISLYKGRRRVFVWVCRRIEEGVGRVCFSVGLSVDSEGGEIVRDQ